MLVSERIGQFFVDAGSGRDRLEYTEYGAGDQWVVLHPRPADAAPHAPAAGPVAGRRGAARGHPRPARATGARTAPSDPLVYSMTAFAEQVVALLDHLEAPEAVIGGTSLGANVSLEVADLAPERVRGLIIEMPVLDNAVEAGILAFAPLMFAARFLPWTVDGLRAVTRPIPRGIVPFWAGIVLDTLDQRSDVGRGGGARPVLRPGRAVVEAPPGRSPRRRWWSVTRPTRSTRPPTPRCWPRRCPTRRSSARGASWSGGSGPSGSTTRPPSSPSRCWARADAPPPDRPR